MDVSVLAQQHVIETTYHKGYTLALRTLRAWEKSRKGRGQAEHMCMHHLHYLPSCLWNGWFSYKTYSYWHSYSLLVHWGRIRMWETPVCMDTVFTSCQNSQEIDPSRLVNVNNKLSCWYMILATMRTQLPPSQDPSTAVLAKHLAIIQCLNQDTKTPIQHNHSLRNSTPPKPPVEHQGKYSGDQHHQPSPSASWTGYCIVSSSM